jgi:ribosomal protein S18 acetylase RimI-like enzyme
MTIERVEKHKVYPLRLQVLRPGGVLSDCVFPGDEDAHTLHLAAFDSGTELVGVASFYRASLHAVFGDHPVQLRGMATHPSVRGKGYGKALVRFALHFFSANEADLSEKAPDVMWCNAREVAVLFYESLGFQIASPRFDIPGIGAHRVMYLKMQDRGI